MANIFVYGSLLHPKEIRKEFGDSIDIHEAILKDFKRHYGQKSKWRTTESGDYGNVLTVEPCKGFECNGLIVEDVPSEFLKKYRERESGYNIHKVSAEKLSSFRGERMDELSEIIVAVGERPTDEWMPLESYMELCEEGARARSKEFYRAFIDTTYRLSDSQDKPHKQESIIHEDS